MRNFAVMQVHSLGFTDFCEDSYTLIGIHTTLEDYKLAYLLNQNLKTNFSRAEYDLDFENEKSNASFSVYDYTSPKYDSDWYLITNSFTQEKTETSKELLFESEIKTYLIPEKKNIDFFIKMTGEIDYDFAHKTIDKIKTIQEVITSYSIDVTILKSKDYLIF